MAHSVLILGVATPLGHYVVNQLRASKQSFSRIAVLVSEANADAEEDGRDNLAAVEYLRGNPSDPKSYQGFGIVVSTLEDDLCWKQEDYIDAAFAGGVKHFYPSEYGADLSNALIQDEPYFNDKIRVREHLKGRLDQDSSLGYTCVMAGVSADLLLNTKVLGLSKDKRSATLLGHPDARVSVTGNEDIARLIVTSLLPQYFRDLNARRHIYIAGSTLPISSLFDAMSYVLQRPIDVAYQPLESLLKENKQTKAGGDKNDLKRASLQRTLGFGGFEIKYPGKEDSKASGVVASGPEYTAELRLKCWAVMVNEHFTKERHRSAA